MTTLTLARLARDVKSFLEFKRAMGCSYYRGEFTLENLKRFAQESLSGSGHKNRSRIGLEETLKAWLLRSGSRKPNSVAADLSVARALCLHRRRSDPSAFVPERDWAPNSRLPFLPYIFSRREVSRLLTAAKSYNHANIGPILLRTLLLILYCTGLRFGEAVRLQMSDVDVDRCTFLVRESKGRTRVVPFGDDLGRELKRWFAKRAEVAARHDIAPTGALFLHDDGRVLSIKRAGDAVTRLVRQEGLKPARGRVGPRPYDWRHTHAVHRLTDWYHQKMDIHARLPWLSAYMGHLNVLGTEVYLHATPELLRLASRRLKEQLHRT